MTSSNRSNISQKRRLERRLEPIMIARTNIIVFVVLLTLTIQTIHPSFQGTIVNLLRASGSEMSNFKSNQQNSQTFLLSGAEAMPFKMNKNTMDMLNKGLTTLIGIKRLLTTIRSVNELSLQAFPSLASKPRIGFIMKLINGGKLPLPHTGTLTTSQCEF